MLEQLDLFGDTPSKPAEKHLQKPKNKYKIVPPQIIIAAEPIKTPEKPEEKAITELVEKKVKGPAKQKAKHNYSSIEIPDDDILFSKQYYPIGEVAKMLNVNISLLRFWEKEFNIIKPRKNRKGDRLFRPEDVKNLKLIYFLLKEKKYTIEGANSFIKKDKHAAEKYQAIESLVKLKQMLLELKAGLEG